jgi:hypothetical protein
MPDFRKVHPKIGNPLIFNNQEFSGFKHSDAKQKKPILPKKCTLKFLNY